MSFKVKKARPLFTGVFTTAKRYVGDQYADVNGLIVDTRKSDGSINPYQKVVAVGSTVRDVKDGDIVYINFKRYENVKHLPGAINAVENTQSTTMEADLSIPMVIIDDQECLFIQVNDIEFVVEECEVDEGGLLQ